MKFLLIDRITELEQGRRIVAHKAVSLAEEYLADHFPTFPVLPGVFVLEAMVQASAWLVRAALDFRPGLVLLKEARNVTYKSFVAPGRVLRVESLCQELTDGSSTFAASGWLEDREIAKGRLTLRHFDLADIDPQLAGVDTRSRENARALFSRLLAGRPEQPALA